MVYDVAGESVADRQIRSPLNVESGGRESPKGRLNSINTDAMKNF